MKSVEDLDVFKLAHQLALKTYSTTKAFPREETFSLVDQMRRAATSVGMNLMEGAMRLGTKEYRQFVGIARGSAGEVCYQLLLAKDLNYISEDTYRELRSGYDRKRSRPHEPAALGSRQTRRFCFSRRERRTCRQTDSNFRWVRRSCFA